MQQNNPNLDSSDARVAAFFAGLAAGVVMALALMARSVAVGEGLWHPFYVISGFWLSPESLAGEALGLDGIGRESSTAILLGAVTHLLVAGGMGNSIGWMTGRETSLVKAALSGLFAGIALWAIMTFLLTPRFAFLAGWVDSQPPAFWFGVHVLYGLVLGALTPPIDRLIRG